MARREGATLYMVLLAAFQVLLARLSGQDDVVVGSPIAGRTHRQTENIVGLFANTAIIRTDVSPKLTFLQLLARVKQTVLEAQTHQELPLEKLIVELQPDRNLSHQSLFQVDFTFQNVPREFLELPGVNVSRMDTTHLTSKLDLSMYIRETATGLAVSFEYATDLFETATIEYWGGLFRALLDDIIERSEYAVSALSLMSMLQRKRMLSEWNDTGAEYPRERCFHELFAVQAAATPEAVAVLQTDRQLTYRELDVRANRLANYFRERGVRPEVVVALCLDRSIEAVVALLAVLKAGGAYLPLDPEQPLERMAQMLDSSGATILVTTSPLYERLPVLPVLPVLLDAEWEEIERHPPTCPNSEAAPTSLAYLIYTSGSTGQPKGVLIEHKGICNLAAMLRSILAVGVGSRVMQFARLTFDASVWEIAMALCSGATLCIPGRMFNAVTDLRETFEAYQISIATLPPSVLSLLGDEPIASLRTLIVAGEECDSALAERWLQRCRFINAYGPTEATVCASFADCGDSAGSVSIGRPIQNMSLYVLDANMEPVPVGLVGELFIAGEGLSRGYAVRAKQTAERFLPNPFGAPGTRLYSTGDRVKYLPDGSLVFVGRNDSQVKIRGLRVELGEIEAVLRQHRQVRDAAVLSLTGENYENSLVAFVVACDPVATKIEDIRDHLTRILPEYMVPAVLIQDSLPLTKTGKTDRRTLHGFLRKAEDSSFPTLPAGSLELKLAEVWRDVLRVESIPADASFFDIGGDSITALRIQAEAATRGIHFSLVDLFKHRSIRGLASHAGRAGYIPSSSLTRGADFLSTADRAMAEAAGYEDAYPLSRLQAGMIYHNMWDKEIAAYHSLTAHILHMPLNEHILQEVVQAAVDRHPVLRTVFHLSGFEQPVQCVCARMAVHLAIDDWSDLDDGMQNSRRISFIETENRHPFNLAVGPLIRFFAHRLGTERFQFVLSSHHALIDGWSDATLLTEIYQDYLHRLKSGKAMSFVPPLCRYSDFVAEEQMAIGDKRHEDFWLEQASPGGHSTLSGIDRTGDSACVGVTVQRVTLEVDEAVATGLIEFARKAGVSPKAAFFAAHLNLIRVLSGNDRIVTGLVTSARPEKSDADRVIGLFLNTVPIPFFQDWGSWSDLARTAMSSEVRTTPHRHYPVVEMYSRLGSAASLETMFAFTNFHAYEALPDEIRIERLQGAGETNFALSIQVMFDAKERGGKFAVSCRVPYFASGQADEIARMYLRSLRRMVAEPDEKYCSFPIAEESDNHAAITGPAAVLSNWDGCCLHELVARQIEARGDTPAVVGEDLVFSYRELGEVSRRIADRLRRLAIGPNEVVGICAARSPYLIAAMLGVLQAGAAYLPIDPKLPSARRDFMLHGLGARVVVIDDSTSELFAEHPTVKLRIDAEGSTGELADAAPMGASCPEDLAYVIFTSGSTGVPKAVACTHANVINLLRDSRWPRADVPEFRGAMWAAPSFDVSVYEIFSVLCSGGTLHLVPESLRAESRPLFQWLRAHEITSAYLPPYVLHEFREWLREESPCVGLRTLVVGGEPIEERLLAALHQSLPSLDVLNIYGSTETTVSATVYRQGSSDLAGRAPIGRSVANLKLYVVDQNHVAVPAGIAGELCISGPGVSRGYLHASRATAERFVPNPFGAPGSRMYRTGDLVRLLPDGNLKFLGRIDHLVRVRGYLVEPSEIEAAMLVCPEIRHALVMGVDAAEPALLRDFLGRHLPEYMVPSAIVAVDALPLTHNGKLDRKALSTPNAEALFLPAYEASANIPIPPNRITPDTECVTSDLLPLIDLAQGKIDHLVAQASGSNLIAQARQGTSVEAHERFFKEMLGS
ncbi:non-ribosomal peptide synthetase, partial [Xanthomonas arboricola]|uniref:non-ribosomal peptide synthetase n=1 Tax=Xanthomonas arboricola TaxID=56448 RepID=UPI0021576E16